MKEIYGREHKKYAVKEQTLYSWRLDRNDKTPAGKQQDLSLREKEKQIEADMFQRIVPEGGNLTVLDLVKNMCH